MKVEVHDAFGYSHVIQSANLDLIGQWFREIATLLVCADTRLMPYRMYIWPSVPNYDAEMDMLKKINADPGRTYEITREGLQSLLGGLEAMIGEEWTSQTRL